MSTEARLARLGLLHLINDTQALKNALENIERSNNEKKEHDVVDKIIFPSNEEK